MLKKWQIKLAMWLLRRSIPPLSGIKVSRSCDLLGDGNDPCQLQRDAKVESGLQVVATFAAFEAALTLDEERAIALMMCEMENNTP